MRRERGSRTIQNPNPRFRRSIHAGVTRPRQHAQLGRGTQRQKPLLGHGLLGILLIPERAGMGDEHVAEQEPDAEALRRVFVKGKVRRETAGLGELVEAGDVEGFAAAGFAEGDGEDGGF